MVQFTELSKKVNERFNELSKHQLFTVDISKDSMWNYYLDAFPAGTNEIYKERREYDCQCCAQFVKNIGNVVAIIDGEIQTVWDIEIGGIFQDVVDEMSSLAKSNRISNIFLHTEPKFGKQKSQQVLESGETLDWNHFHCELPKELVEKDNCASLLGKSKTNKQVYERGLLELSVESLEIVLDLINDGQLHKGDEYKRVVKKFLSLKKNYDRFEFYDTRDIFVWETFETESALIRNTVIGTLLQDISNGVDLTRAVNSFETKVAGPNFKRSSAPITKAMVEKMMKRIDDLGLRSALDRRPATVEDVSINNVIFADRNSSVLMKDSLASEMMKEVKESTKSYDEIGEVSIEQFIKDIVPQIDSMEILFEGKHTNNLVSLVGAKHDDAEQLFKWENQFSWSYVGNITDSISERVKRAGGNLNGVLRASLGWFNTDDLDIHIYEPNNSHIWYQNARSPRSSSGVLDVDMNVENLVKDPVENVVWTNKSSMPIGDYKVVIDNYSKRNSTDIGFELEIEFDNKSTIYHYPKAVQSKEKVAALTVNYDGNNFKVIKVNKHIETQGKSKEVWNISTEKFQKVSLMCLSPNFWNEQEIGHKHYMFMLDDCKNDERTRGIYNEFLRNDLHEDRKAFEVLADKTKCEITDNQLSGLGFSSTKRASVVCKVKGSFSRTLKINF